MWPWQCCAQEAGGTCWRPQAQKRLWSRCYKSFSEICGQENPLLPLTLPEKKGHLESLKDNFALPQGGMSRDAILWEGGCDFTSPHALQVACHVQGRCPPN